MRDMYGYRETITDYPCSQVLTELRCSTEEQRIQDKANKYHAQGNKAA